MKKIYSFLIVAILAMVGAEAFAAALTVTVKVNDPSLVTVYPYFQAGDPSQGISSGNQPNLVFDADGECVVEFPDGCTMAMMRYLYVTPADGNYITTLTAYDCDDEIVSGYPQHPNKNKKTGFSLPAGIDGGRFEIEVGELSDSKITVNLDGSPEKFSFTIDGRSYEIVEGTQQIEFTPGARLIYIQTAPGVAELYKVEYNGTAVQGRDSSAEGVVNYGYIINNPADGATLNIETDFPDRDCKVTIQANNDSFIQHVYVDGEETWDYYNEDFTVKLGQSVRVEGDAYNFQVNSSSIDGVETAVASAALQRTVMDDITFSFDVTYIERDHSFIAYVAPGFVAKIKNNHNGVMALDEGYQRVDFSDTDNPILFYIDKVTNSNFEESDAPYIYLNETDGELTLSRDLTIADGDVVKFFYGSEPQLYTVTYTIDPEISSDLTIKRDVAIDVDPATGHSSLQGTKVIIYEPYDEKIVVTVNGEEVENNYGMISFIVTEDTEVAITKAPTVPLNVTFNVNNPAGVRIMYAAEYIIELEGESTQVDLGQYPDEGWSMLQVYAADGYYFTAATLNGVDILGDEDYDYGGQFVFMEINEGDVYSFEVAEVVRDQHLVFFISGADKASGWSLSIGETNLAQGAGEGYNDVYFAEQDVPLLFSPGYCPAGENTYVYLNNEEVEFFWGYDIYCQDGDVMKVFFSDAAPDVWSVTYEVEGLEKPLDVKVDHVKDADMDGHAVLHGTHICIKAHPDETIASVKVNETEVAPEDGAYSFYVTDHSAVRIVGAPSGIADIEAANGQVEYFNLQGIRIANPQPGQVVIVKNGSAAAKQLVK